MNSFRRNLGIALIIATALFVTPRITLAVTLAEFTGGTTLFSSGHGQSFTTAAGSASTNIVFNFFSDAAATNPVAQGIGYLLTQEYLGTAPNLVNLTPADGLLGTATGDGDFYSFNPSVILQPNTQYFFYADAFFQISYTDSDAYSGGSGYARFPFQRDGDNNFRVTGTPVSGVPENGSSLLLLGVTLLAIVTFRRWRVA
ncbi:MAG TPA: hypothetical protein VIT23_10710 [Terrimicrobiaceae bacterium]